MIDRNDVLLKRAVSSSGINPYCVDLDRSAVEEFSLAEYAVLRSNADILSVFLVDAWQVKELAPELWPDYLLDEAETIKV